MAGHFFVFEGIDGCGKSTQVSLLLEVLANRGFEVLQVREPGGTTISEKIREILLDKKNSGMISEAELLLYNAARAQLVHEVILPAMQAGKIVVADRFSWSTLAYQGYGRGLDLDAVGSLLNFACGELKADHTWVFDLDPAVARSRRKGEDDRLESEEDDFFARVRQGYVELCEQHSENSTLLDATREVMDLHREVMGEVDDIL